MPQLSHLSTLERYQDYRVAIHDLLSSIIISFADEQLLEQDDAQRQILMNTLVEHYPFVSVLYTLDANGRQQGASILNRRVQDVRSGGNGFDRSTRPYYLQARDTPGIAVTEPYISANNRALCISTAMRYDQPDGRVSGYLVLDIDLAETLSFFMGDSRRRIYEPFFKVIYVAIAIGLFIVVAALLWDAFLQLVQVFVSPEGGTKNQLKPFGVVIYLTLALAIFDLGKTTLEEEVLLSKDIFRHSSTRRTITRFIAAILIAISIESLMMIFKFALGDQGSLLVEAVWVMMAAVGLLLGLGVYVYLGARAEKILLEARQQK